MSARFERVTPASSSSRWSDVASSRRSASARRSAAAWRGVRMKRSTPLAAHRRLTRPRQGPAAPPDGHPTPHRGNRPVITPVNQPPPRQAALVGGTSCAPRTGGTLAGADNCERAGQYERSPRGSRAEPARTRQVRTTETGGAGCARRDPGPRRRGAQSAPARTRRLLKMAAKPPLGRPRTGSARYLRRYPRNERLSFSGCAAPFDAATLRKPVGADGTIGVGSLGFLPGSQP